MFNLIKMIFAGPETAGKLVNAGLQALDNSKWTAEEQSAYVTKWMTGTTGQAISRRVLAWAVCVVWVPAAIAGLIVVIWGEAATYQQIKSYMEEVVNDPFMLVMFFYFAPHAIAAVANNITARAKA